MSSELRSKLVVMTVCGVRGYEEDGTAYLHIEDAARGLGFTRVAESGNEVIRWERVEGYLSDLHFVPTRGHGDSSHDYYIPENIFYRLCMKAKNEVAEAFQAKVADEIIPSIRKTGRYEVLPSNYIEALEALLASEKEKERVKLALEEEKDAHERDNEDYQMGLAILNVQKSQIASKQVATSMATASRAVRIANDALQQVAEASALVEETNIAIEKLRDDLRSKTEEARNIIRLGLTTYDESLKCPERTKDKEHSFGVYVRNALNRVAGDMQIAVKQESADNGHQRNLYPIEVCRELEKRIRNNREYLKEVN